MSTKATIKSRTRTEELPGFHLYDDVLDDFAGDAEVEPPVYLTLEGVAVELQTRCPGGDWVTLAIPRALARELGILPASRDNPRP